MFPFLPATRRAFQNVRSFVKELDDKLSATPTSSSTPRPTSDAIADELESNADVASVVRGDGLEVASGRMAGLELANEGEKEEEQEQPTQDLDISATGLGLDFGTPPSETQTRPSTSSPRRHNRGLTSPLMRMAPTSPISSISESLPHQGLQFPTSPPRSLSSSWLAPSTSPTPPPSVRVRSRVLSHPDIADLCASFAARPGMARTTTFSAQGDDEDEDESES